MLACCASSPRHQPLILRRALCCFFLSPPPCDVREVFGYCEPLLVNQCNALVSQCYLTLRFVWFHPSSSSFGFSAGRVASFLGRSSTPTHRVYSNKWEALLGNLMPFLTLLQQSNLFPPHLPGLGSAVGVPMARFHGAVDDANFIS